jgi:hypothetical protein
MPHVDEGTLHAYLDGELSLTERAASEAHLAQCEACRARLLDERALRERSTALLRMALPVERPVPPFEQLRRVPKSFRLQIRTSVAWAASIALALGLGYYLHDSATRAAPSGSLDAGTIVAAAPPQEKPRRSMSQKSGERNQRKPDTDEPALPSSGDVALRDAPPSLVAVYIYLQPLVAALMAFPVLGETPTTGVLLGGAIIFAGVYISTRRA